MSDALLSTATRSCAYCGQAIDGHGVAVTYTVKRALSRDERARKSRVAGRDIQIEATARMKVVHEGACQQFWNRVSREEWAGVR